MLLISFLQPSTSSLTLIDLPPPAPAAFLSVQSRLPAAKKFTALKEKKKRATRDDRMVEEGEHDQPDGEPAPVKRDDIENFGGNRREGNAGEGSPLCGWEM